MSRKIICPFHSDSTPSLHLYDEWAFCFVCRVSVPISELNLDPSMLDRQARREPTNVTKMVEYIKGLTIKSVRGLQLPADCKGFYVVWPNGSFYKRRNWEGKARYIAPTGVTPPLFVYPGAAKHLIIVEGELNAITLHNVAYGDFKICSPGPASDFMRHIKYYSQFQRITIFADHDAPGVVFGVQLKNHLLSLSKRVNLITLTTDFNQTLQDSGEVAVKAQFEEGMR